MSSRLLSPLLLVLAAAALHGCGDSEAPSTPAIPACGTIEVVDNAYSPKICTAKVGQTVQWVWKGQMDHDVVSGTKSGNTCTKDTKFPSSALQITGTYSHTFTAAGDYPYFCTPHCAVDMVGTIRVQ